MTKPASPTPDSFVDCVHHAIEGRLAELRACLDAEPSLVHARSAAPFRATLLHYATAANGVENELQRTPPNAVEIATLLLDRGAEADALSDSYGGGPNATSLCLLVSSWHPFEAGVQPELVQLLVERGARVNGLEDDGMPLATALRFGYSSAARMLANCGARIDNLFFAAGLGDIARVSSFFSESEGQPPVAPEVVQEGLHFAVSHGHLEVAQYLLDRGASVTGTSLGHHCELPLHQTIFVKRWEAARWLLKKGADLDAVDGKRGETARAMAGGQLSSDDR